MLYVDDHYLWFEVYRLAATSISRLNVAIVETNDAASPDYSLHSKSLSALLTAIIERCAVC